MLPDPNTAQSIGWLTLAAFSLIGGINQALQLTDRLKGKPPADVLASKSEELKSRLECVEAEAVDQTVCRATHAEVNRRLNELEKLGKEADERRRAIYAEIGKVRDAFKADMQRIEDKLEVMPGRVIEILRQTKVIR